MWVKTEKKDYLNLDNGQRLCVVEAKHGGEHRIIMRGADNVTPLYSVQGGYRDEEEARNALDALMDSMDESVLEVTLPEAVEEDEDDTEE
jgi:hypothetical protein